MSTHPPYKDYCQFFVGLDVKTPVLDGSQRRYTNFDNAASTPSLTAAQKALNEYCIKFCRCQHPNPYLHFWEKHD